MNPKDGRDFKDDKDSKDCKDFRDFKDYRETGRAPICYTFPMIQFVRGWWADWKVCRWSNLFADWL